MFVIQWHIFRILKRCRFIRIFFLAVGKDLVSEDHWASKECLLKWSQLFKINWVFLRSAAFSFPSSLPSSLWYDLSLKKPGQIHTSFKQTG